MTGNLPQKTVRLANHLITHPRYWGRYLQHNVIRPRSPLELEVPWFSYAAIDFLDTFLRPDMDAAEYGSGGSTLFLARRVRQVFSVEDNQEWYDRVCQQLNEKKVTNAMLKLHPYDFKAAMDFENSSYLHAIPDGPLDVIVVDGSEEWNYVRPICFRHAERHVKPGGIIIVDDSWRYPELHRENRACQVEVFKSVGPGRPGVTSTDVFFY